MGLIYNVNCGLVHPNIQKRFRQTMVSEGGDVSPREFAESFGELRYSAMAEYLDELEKRFRGDSESCGGGIEATRLGRISAAFRAASIEVRNAASDGRPSPVCRYCGGPVERVGEVHAGGCGTYG